MNITLTKSWEGRYFKNPDADFNLKSTLYATYANFAEKHLDDKALYVNDTEKWYTHRELLGLINKASNGFHSLGINMNSKVGVFLNGSIEEAVTLLALNKLGAVSKYIDYLKSIPAMKHSLKETKLDLLVMDECFLPLEKLINDDGIKVVVANTKNNYRDNKYISYKKLYKENNLYNNTVTSPYVDEKPTIMINSSGTTGEPKPIVHTDYSVNAAAQKMLYTDYPLKTGHVLLKIIPSYIGLGLITSLYTGLISGVQVVLAGGDSPQDLAAKTALFTKNFKKFKEINHLDKNASLNIFAAPAFMRAIIQTPEITDLSFIGSMLAAGSKMTKEELDDLDRIAVKKGCKVPICNGYGQNEMAGAVTLNLINHNVNGSAGFPTFGSNVIVVNPETKEILPPNNIGLILECCNSKFIEYENLKEKTKMAYITLSDGSRWFNSHDLGYMDENGFLYITGRTSRVVIRSDLKISLDDIERKIVTLSYIVNCATIVPEHGGSEEKIIAFIQAESNNLTDIINRIKTANILSEYEMPSEFLLVECLPYKTNGKIDYETLKKLYNMKVSKNANITEK